MLHYYWTRCKIFKFSINFFTIFLFDILAPSKINHTSDNQTVNQNDKVHLNCTADGLPAPTIFWTRLSNNSNVTMPLYIRGRKDQGGYRCTAYNGVGDPDTADVFITVQSESNSFFILEAWKIPWSKNSRGRISTAHISLVCKAGVRWLDWTLFRVLK